MRGRKRVLSIIALLSVVAIVSAVFASGVVDVSKLSLLGAPAPVEPTQATSVFVNPNKIIKDYQKDPGYKKGDKFTVHVNISDISDLFAWQMNLTWNKAVLNVSRIIRGEFLARSPNQTSSELLLFVMNATYNDKGYGGFAEAIMGNVSGVSTPPTGRLVSIEFLIVGYGWSNITISKTGLLATMLLNSTGASKSFTKVDGYFSNKIAGDVNGDKTVNIDDLSMVGAAFGSTPGKPTWNFNADLNKDNIVNIDDLSQVGANFGRSVTV